MGSEAAVSNDLIADIRRVVRQQNGG